MCQTSTHLIDPGLVGKDGHCRKSPHAVGQCLRASPTVISPISCCQWLMIDQALHELLHQGCIGATRLKTQAGEAIQDVGDVDRGEARHRALQLREVRTHPGGVGADAQLGERPKCISQVLGFKSLWGSARGS